MASQDVDLTLPSRVPGLAHYTKSYIKSSFAIYSIVAMNDEALSKFVTTSIGDVDIPDRPPLGKLAPDSNMSGKPLRQVLESHVRLAASQDKKETDPEYHPCTFIAVVSQDWSKDGVLAVCMNYDFNGGVDCMRLQAEACAGRLFNIEIGNSSWEETKETAREKLPQIITIEGGLEQTKLNSDIQSSGEGSVQESQSPHFCVYKSVQGVNMRLLLNALNGEGSRKLPPGDVTCQTPPWIHHVPQSEDTLPQVLKVHHSFVGQYKKYNPSLIVVADHGDFEEKGVLLMNLGLETKVLERRSSVGEAAGFLTAVAELKKEWTV